MSREQLLTVAQAAPILGIKDHGVRHLIRSGQLKALHFGPSGSRGCYLIERADLDDFKGRRRSRGRPKTTTE